MDRQAPAPDALSGAREQVIAALAARLGADPAELDPDTRFSELGLDSAGATALAAELSRRLGRPLPSTAAWDHPTAGELARFLAGPPDAPAPGATGPGGALAPDEPIAVVGMACRFPGAPGLDAYWRLLCEGGDAVTEVPADRWDAAALYHPDPAEPGRANTRWGGFLDGVDRFDPQFFGISPREAALMDPQQRIMLELAWTALEDSGTDPGTLRDSRTGVFTAALWNDYARLTGRDLAAIGQHSATGEDLSIIAARISYVLGLRGPSIGVTTACSGALVAVHLACQSLRGGESEVALAGGVNLLLAPESTTAMAKFGAMSPRGRSRAFDAGADGYVRGEGGGLVVLKPLSRALADGDRVYCVLRGSAVNNDGYSNGLTAPNPQAQEDMLRQAYARAGVAPHTVQYVEAHGTGTALGDPIEAGALARVLGAGRPADRPLLLGSAKTNLGHLESAAGIAGLIKTALALHHRVLPPSLHFERPNPGIDFGAGIEVVTATRPWPDGQRAALAGVSSFGFGGTNCHVVLEGAPPPARLLTLSAPDARRLGALASAAADDVRAADPAAGTADLVAAAVRRATAEPGERRAAAVVRTRGELLAALERIAAAGENEEIGEGGQNEENGEAGDAGCPEPAAAAAPRTVFVFSGQGAQWAGMGRELLHREPVFRAAVEECDAVFTELGGRSVVQGLLAADAAALTRSDVLQPLIFTVQIGLVALWRSRGVTPDAVIGHSLGEAAAAHVAGRLGLRDAVRVVHHRSRLMARLDGTGAVALVALDVRDAEAAAERHGAGRVEVAGENGPRATVLAGEPAALDACLAALERDGVECHRVAMPVASHTAACDALLPELGESLAELRPLAGRVPFVSTVTGSRTEEPLDAAYWQRNLRQRVRFGPAVASVLAAGPAAFLEIGPHPVLARALGALVAAHGHDDVRAPVLAGARRDADAHETLLGAAARLYEYGAAPDQYPDQYPDHYGAAPAGPPQAPGEAGDAAAGSDERPAAPRLLTLSAHTEEAARAQAAQLADLLAAPADGAAQDVPDDGLDALCDAAARLRGGHRHRVAAVVRDRAEAAQLLRRAAAGEEAAGLATGAVPRRPGRLAFVFSGQGTQWAAMGRGLADREPVFRRALERYDELLRGLTGGDWSLLAELAAPEDRSRLQETWLAQPALVALQLALVDLWEHWGVRPDAVTGHSVGEIAAACVAGALEPAQALRIAVERGAVMHAATGRGRMVSLALPEAEVAALLAGFGPDLGIAAVNGPAATVVAGATDAVARLLAAPGPAGVRTHRLAVDYAFHSPQMDPYQDALADRLRGPAPQQALAPRPARLPLVSTVTGAPVEGTALDAAHWGRSVRATVRFADAVAALAELGCTDFLEVGPHPALVSATTRCLAGTPAAGGLVLPTLRRGDDLWTPLHSRAALWTAGRPAVRTASGAATAGPGRPVRLPEFPWQRSRHWITPAPLGGAAGTAGDPGPVGRLLRTGRLAELAGHLERRHRLSDAERTALPRLLELLAQTETETEREAGAATPAGAARDADPDAALRYTVRWHATDAAPAAPAALTAPAAPVDDRTAAGHWLLAGEGELTEALAARLRAGGGTVTVLDGRKEEFAAAVDTALDAAAHPAPGGAPVPLRGVVHLHGAEVPPDEDAGGAVRQATASALLLAQRLAARSLPAAARLWLVTEGARPDAGPPRPFAAGGGPVAGARELAGAALWGFGGTLGHELPELLGGLIDVDGSAPARTAGLLVAELRREDREDRVALRDGVRQVARLTPADPDPVAAGPAVPLPGPELDPAAAYLVTGGLGGIGLRLARHLAERGARRLVLLGRRAPDAQADAVLEQLRAKDVEVTVAQADVSRRDDLVRVLDGIREQGVPLRGIVHAAGVLDDGVVLRQDPERIARVLAPKVLGALHLHELTAGRPLDFLVLFSSFTATLGAGGQAGYTAANAVLDTLAARLRATGTPAVSLGWGPWSGVGMTAGDGAGRQRWAQRGLPPLDPAACLRAFDRAVAGARSAGPAHEVVLDADWPAYRASLPDGARRPFLDEVLAGAAGGAARGGGAGAPGDGQLAATGATRTAEDAAALAAALEGVHPEDRAAVIADHVARRVAEVLGLPDARRLDREAGLFDLGLDSLAATGLAGRLARDLGQAGGPAELSATTAFDHPSVAALAAHLTELLTGTDGGGAGQGPAAGGTGDADLEDLLAEIENLSEDEAARRLAELAGDGPHTGMGDTDA
ncbi:SDR family NAD(P)-dependent oxidoreductase [Streptomyces sp. S186]|uniref:SDR family NAD(P)-dependent oxidoreductase n=1 Tax=Streptomyces sp. S186 TaxID=3434395 RepID=UPI003F66CA93